MLYPQNGYRIVAIDSVTSFRPMYFNVRSKADIIKSAKSTAQNQKLKNGKKKM